MSVIQKGAIVWSRDGEIKGVASGSVHRCQLEGCRGVRISVKWANGQITFPCSEGMLFNVDGSAQIL